MNARPSSFIEFLESEDVEPPIVGVADIGAAMLTGVDKEYQSLLDAKIARVIGFEPVPEECARLNREIGRSDTRFLPHFVGDGTEQVFCLNSAPMTSSLYEANVPLLGLFQNLLELTTTVSREKVLTSRLDDIQEITFPLDYIKIDVQGAELQVFKHGEERLKNVTVIQTEVEWVPLYQGQPLFAEVDQELRRQGFVLHRVLGFGTRSFKPFRTLQSENVGHQALWSDVIFVKDFTRLERLSRRQLLAYALIMVEVYDAPDLAHHVLVAYDQLATHKLAEPFRRRYYGKD